MEKMLQAMMKRYPLFIGMGMMIVMIALIIGAVNAVSAANYYAVDKATRDALVTGYEPLTSCLNLPDPDDRHVLAAAIVGHCDVIVTQNLQDFPQEVLKPFGIEVQHPDDFLANHLNLAPGKFCVAVRKVRARLKNPPYSVEDYLATLTRQGLVVTVAELEQYAQLI